MMITMEHIRKAKMCSSGTRRFFERQGWDWGDFLKRGKPEEDFIKTGDAMARQVVEVARGR